MKMLNVSIRLPAEALAKLRAQAHIASLRTGREIRWSTLVRELVEKHMLADDGQPPIEMA